MESSAQEIPVMPNRSASRRSSQPNATTSRVRTSQSDVILASTLHDPGGDLAGEIRRWLPRLRRAYADMVVATSPSTAEATNDLLEERGVFIGTLAANERGPLYRLSIREGLRRSGSRVHYLDFDRALHWARGPIHELEALVERSKRHPVLLVGRTPAAHESHQEALVVTETETNRHLARGLGVRGRVDFMVPSFVLDREAARAFLSASRTRGMGIYGEMAGLLFALGHDVAYVECDGLDWETPDRDRRTVSRVGLEAYRDRFDRHDEWRLRYALQRAVEAAFDRVRARLGHPAARLRRLRLGSRPMSSSSLSRTPSTIAI